MVTLKKSLTYFPPFLDGRFSAFCRDHLRHEFSTGVHMGELIRYDGTQWTRLKALVLDSVRSRNSKRAYGGALENFLAWYHAEPRPPLSKAVVSAYKAHLVAAGHSASTISVRLSALKKLAAEAADNELIAPELAAGIARVGGVPRHGIRLGNWLGQKDAGCLINSPDPVTIKAKRDRAILAVLIGCGLRRSEAASLTLEHLQKRAHRWVIIDLLGKHGRIRSVVMPDWAKAAIDEWISVSGISAGRLFRRMNRADRVLSQPLGDKSIWTIVKGYAAAAGLGKLAPHDLRRTYAKLAYDGGARLEQVQMSLGHASMQTTERYLGAQQDLTDAPCDHLGLDLQRSVTELERAA